MHDVSRIHLPQPDSPGERRCDVAIRDVQLRGVDLRLVVAHCSIKLIHQRLLCVDLLLRDAARGNQRRISLQIQPRVPQLCLIAEQLRLQLLHLHLEGPRVEPNSQPIVIADHPSFEFLADGVIPWLVGQSVGVDDA